MLKLIDADEDLSRYAADIKAAGIDGILGYLRILTPEIVANYHAAGLVVGCIDEHTATEALAGAVGGGRDGTAAATKMAVLGAPTGAGVYATVDTDVTAAQLGTVEDYFTAYDPCIDPPYRIGGYADGTALSGLRSLGMPLMWLAGAMGWDGSHEFLANGNPTIVQGPTIGADETGVLLGQNFPALPFDYDPNVAMVDSPADAGLW